MEYNYYQMRKAVPDPLGIRSIIQSNFNGPVSGELERLFMNDRRRMGAVTSCDATRSSSASVWEDFNRNGRDGDLDELDKLFRGVDLNALPSSTATTSSCSMNVMIPQPGYRGNSTCGSSSSSSSPKSSSIDDDYNPDILTREKIFEILQERERQKRKKMSKVNKATGKVCVFCRNNGEAEAVYTSHQLKDAMGRITCPVLYIYTCPICGAKGETAHTIKYCPYNTGGTDTVRLLKTPRTSAGRRRLSPHLTPAHLSPAFLGQ